MRNKDRIIGLFYIFIANLVIPIVSFFVVCGFVNIFAMWFGWSFNDYWRWVVGFILLHHVIGIVLFKHYLLPKTYM